MGDSIGVRDATKADRVAAGCESWVQSIGNSICHGCVRYKAQSHALFIGVDRRTPQIPPDSGSNADRCAMRVIIGQTQREMILKKILPGSRVLEWGSGG